MPTSSFNEEIWRSSPEYRAAYDEGYRAAIRRIRKFLEVSEPLESLLESLTGTPHQLKEPNTNK